MSGGSFNYASDATDLEDLLSKRFDLDQLRDRLYSHHDGIEMDDVAADLDSLLAYVAQVNRRVVARLKRLQPVMHAVEWRDSGDWGPDRVRDAVAKYRALDEPPAYASTPHPRPLIEVFDEAHLDDPLTGKVSFIFIEKWSDKDATDHLTQMHGRQLKPGDLLPANRDSLNALHTRLHPTEGHCHAKGGHRTTTIEPLIGMLDDMTAMRHMRIAHAHDYVLGPTNSREGLDRTHAELHEKHQGLVHEHRRA